MPLRFPGNRDHVPSGRSRGGRAVFPPRSVREVTVSASRRSCNWITAVAVAAAAAAAGPGAGSPVRWAAYRPRDGPGSRPFRHSSAGAGRPAGQLCRSSPCVRRSRGRRHQVDDNESTDAAVPSFRPGAEKYGPRRERACIRRRSQ